MAMTVEQLRDKLREGDGKTVSITGAELGLPNASTVFDAHLPDSTLIITNARSDVAGLTVSGTTTLGGSSMLAVDAKFIASGQALASFAVEIALADWHVRTRTVDADYGELAEDGFHTPRVVLDDVGAALVYSAGETAADGVSSGSAPPIDLRTQLGDDISQAIDGVVDEADLLLSDVAEALGFPSIKDAVGYATKHVWYKHYRSAGKPYVVSGDVDLTDVPVVDKVRWVLASSKETGGKRTYFGVVEVLFNFDTSAVPVLSGLIPAENMMVGKGITLMFTTKSLSMDDVVPWNTRLREAGHDVPVFPADGLKKGVSLGFDYQLGGQDLPMLVTWLAGKSKGSWSPPDEQVSTSIAHGDGVVEKAASTSGSGPIRLKYIEPGFEDGKPLIKVSLQANVKGLVVDIKFHIGVPIGAHQKFSFAMGGIGFELDRGPIELIGAAIYEEPTDEYVFRLEGLGMLTTPAVAVGIAGGYAQLTNGLPSVFLFGSVGAADKEGGFGPPPFRVKGAYLGGGYNSAVRVPEVAEVYKFPLVAGLDNPDVVGGQGTGPLHVLEVLAAGDHAWVKPASGENWLAIGLRFTTFEMFETTALALVEFGNDLVIALLGLTTAEFPQDRPDGEAPWAKVQVATEALYRQSEGLLALTAQLTPNSYLMAPACALTGGLAANVWVGGPHQGEFVISLGGYHPAFTVPDHYPVVPRVGYTWGISNEVNMRGEAYFALTPHAAMAGGALALTFHDGALKAWLTAHLDALVEWDPFWFLVDIGVSIGVSLTIDVWFVHATLSAELGVDLDLWGPPVGGQATVHLWFVSFTIGFGADKPGDRPSVSWDQFRTQLPPSTEINQIRPVKGLEPEQESTDLVRDTQGPAPWVVSTHGFSFTTATAFPASHVVFGDRTVATRDDGVNIRPMAKTGLTSTQTVTVTRGGASVDVSGWSAEAVAGNVPESLWGDGSGPSLSGTGLVDDRLTGLKITVPAPHLADSLDVAAGVLDLDPITPDGAVPLSASASPAGPVPRTDTGSVATIASGIATDQTTRARNDLYTVLATVDLAPSSNDSMTGYAGLVTHDLAAAPLVATSGA